MLRQWCLLRPRCPLLRDRRVLRDTHLLRRGRSFRMLPGQGWHQGFRKVQGLLRQRCLLRRRCSLLRERRVLRYPSLLWRRFVLPAENRCEGPEALLRNLEGRGDRSAEVIAGGLPPPTVRQGAPMGPLLFFGR